MSKPIVAVTGATGAQGGSVVKYLLQDGSFNVRAITRNPQGEAGQKLKSQGVEVVQGSFDDTESLVKAFQGADYVFGLTDFWQYYLGKSGDKYQYNSAASQAAETKDGKAIVDACKAANVKFLLYSSLEDSKKPRVPHFTSKEDVEKYRVQQGVPGCGLYTSFYYENLWTFGMLKKNDSGEWELQAGFPKDSKLFGYAVGETGGWATAIFKNPKAYLNKKPEAVGEYISPAEMGQALSQVTGKNVSVPALPVEVFTSDDFKNVVGEELWLNMLLFHNNQPGDANNEVGRDVEASHKIFPGSNFRDFISQSAQLKSYMGL